MNALQPLFDPATESHFLQIDGVSQPNMYAYRQTSDPSAPFSYTTTSRDNFIDQIVGSDTTLGTGVFPSTVSPVVEDGYWAALQPFAPGSTHVLRYGFQGGGSAADITYVITTVPEPTTIGLVAALVLSMITLSRRSRGRCFASAV